MTYNEIARRAFEQQGYDEWLGPKAIEYEKKIRENYIKEKEKEQNQQTQTRLTARNQS